MSIEINRTTEGRYKSNLSVADLNKTTATPAASDLSQLNLSDQDLIAAFGKQLEYSPLKLLQSIYHREDLPLPLSPTECLQLIIIELDLQIVLEQLDLTQTRLQLRLLVPEPVTVQPVQAVRPII